MKKQNQQEYDTTTPNYAILNEELRKQQRAAPAPKTKKQKAKSAIAATTKVAACLVLMLFVFIGCATSPAGQAREDKILQAIENTRNFLDHSVLPAVPSPYKEALGLLSLAAGAGLTAWNTKQGQRIKTLEEQHQALKAVVQIHAPDANI